jgi:hypothetical protein
MVLELKVHGRYRVLDPSAIHHRSPRS